MGISVGCQGLSRVIDEMFADLKGRYIFNFVDDLVVYSASPGTRSRGVTSFTARGFYSQP